MEAKNIVSSLLTSLLCIASFSTPTTKEGISHAVGYMILANIANLYQLILWNTDPFLDLKIFCKGPRNSIWPSVIVKFNHPILQTILLYLPLYVTIVLSWIGALVTANKGMVFVSLGLYFLGVRSFMAMFMYQFPMPYSSSLKNFNEYLNLITGLRLCEEIKRDDWEKVDDDDGNEDYDEGFVDDDDDGNEDYDEGFVDDDDGNEDYDEGFVDDDDDGNEDYEEGFIYDDDDGDEDYDEGFIDDDDGNEDYDENFIDDDEANEDYDEGFIDDDDDDVDEYYDEGFIDDDDDDANEDCDEGSIIEADKPLKEAQDGLIEPEGWVVVNKID